MSVEDSSENSTDWCGPPVDELLRHGSREAMADVFSRHVDTIYNFCYRRTGSWSVAEDLTSQVFLIAWRRHRRVVTNDSGSVLPWLYGVATNVCRNHLRSVRRGAAALSRIDLVEPRPLDDQVLDQLTDEQRLRRALDALAALPSGDQDVFVLVCWEELSYADAAAALGIRLGTVKSRLSRVRNRLRAADEAPTSPSPNGRVRDRYPGEPNQAPRLAPSAATPDLTSAE